VAVGELYSKEKENVVMKKLLALVLILGLSSVASANFVLSVGGVVEPADSTITLAPSDEVIIDVHALLAGGAGDYPALAVFATGPGTVAVGDNPYVWGDGGMADIVDPELSEEWIPGIESLGYPGATSAILLELVDTAEPFDTYPAGLVADGIIFHCEGIGDALIGLFDASTYEVYDTVIIHQVPEPMTLSLLGLGGLGLLRRRRA